MKGEGVWIAQGQAKPERDVVLEVRGLRTVLLGSRVDRRKGQRVLNVVRGARRKREELQRRFVMADVPSLVTKMPPSGWVYGIGAYVIRFDRRIRRCAQPSVAVESCPIGVCVSRRDQWRLR